VFIQVIQGRVKDANGFRGQFDKWQRELMPGATGFIGSTAGVTADNDFIIAVRFDSKEAAERNAARPEQDAFWNESQQFIEGDVRFRESEDVHVLQFGDPDTAKFVQVMDGLVTDRDKAIALTEKAQAQMPKLRPDLLGAVDAYFDGGEFVSINYFTNEAEARAAEKAEMPKEVGEMMAEYGAIMKIDRYIDITDPRLVSP
jgi:hypothetical protein